MAAASVSSSDVDEEETERLRSVAVDSVSVAAALSQKKNKKHNPACSGDEYAPSPLKFYQARARDLLHQYLDETFDIKRMEYEEIELPGAHFVDGADDTGFRLFKNAPTGLSDNRPRQGQLTEAISTPRRMLQDHNPDESSEMFQARLSATAIEGMAVRSHAEKAKVKAFTSWVLHQAKEKETKRREEERIALLKMQRGERWLPSIAKDMQSESSVCGGSLPVKKVMEAKRCKDLGGRDGSQKFKKKTSKLSG